MTGLVGLGLGTSSITPSHFPSLVENLILQKPLQQPVFTCLLTRPSEQPGFYTFGYIDDILSKPGIVFNNIVTNGIGPGQWEIKSEYAVLNGIHIQTQTNTVVVDTGTPGILLEESLVRDIYALLHGQFDTDLQSWKFPANLTEFPMVTLPVGVSNITLTPPDFAIGQPDDAGWVFGSIQSRKKLLFDVFGHSWLNNIYAVFDLGMTGAIVRFGLSPRN